MMVLKRFAGLMKAGPDGAGVKIEERSDLRRGVAVIDPRHHLPLPYGTNR